MKKTVLILCAFCLLKWAPFSVFAQTGGVITLPYSTGFEADETEAESYWDSDGDMIYWIVGEAAFHTGLRSLYVSPEEAAEYYPNVDSRAHYYASVMVPASGMYIEFDYKIGGRPVDDVLLVGILGAGTTPNSLYDSDTYTYLDTLCCTEGEWLRARILVSEAMAGEKVLVFTWRNRDGDEYEGQGAIIDNLELKAIECLTPANPVITDIQPLSAVFSWDVSTSAGDYLVRYRTTAPQGPWYTLSVIGQTSCTIPALEANTPYEAQVATVCSVNDTSLYTESVTFTTEESCKTPHSLTMVTLTDTSALVSWASRITPADQFLLQYGVEGSSLTPVSVTDTFFLIPGLTPGTVYEVNVFRICGDSEQSDSTRITFLTPCSSVVYPLPFEEGFEDALFPPSCWSAVRLSGPDQVQWERETQEVHTGNGAARFNSETIRQDISGLLITPRLDISSENDIKVHFSTYRTQERIEKIMEGIRVWVNENPDTVNAVELIHVPRVPDYEPVEFGEGWFGYTVTLPSLDYDYAYILFEGIGQDGNNVYLDNVRVFEDSLIPKEISASICENDEYDFYGEMLTAAGTYRDTIPGSTGLDTLVILHLSVNLIDTTILNEAICAGGSYTIGDSTYMFEGTYEYIAENQNGCDSIIILNLTVNTVPEAPFITEENSNDQVFLVTDDADELQWYKDNVAIPGATSHRLEVTENGTYYATISNDCGESDSSNHITVIISGISEFADAAFSVYPNPATEVVNIQHDRNPISMVEIYTLEGKKIYETRPEALKVTIPAGNFRNGIYMVRVMVNGQYHTVKIQVVK